MSKTNSNLCQICRHATRVIRGITCCQVGLNFWTIVDSEGVVVKKATTCKDKTAKNGEGSGADQVADRSRIGARIGSRISHGSVHGSVTDQSRISHGSATDRGPKKVGKKVRGEKAGSRAYHTEPVALS